MKTQIQPWSAADEFDDESPLAIVAESTTESSAPAGGDQPFRARIGPRWALAPLAAAALIEAMQWGGPIQARLMSVLSGACLLGAGLALWLGLKTQRRQMQDLLLGAGSTSRQKSGPRLTGDLRDFEATLRTHLERIEASVQKSRDDGLSLGYRLAATEKRHTRAVLDCLADAVIVVDSGGRLAYANEPAGTLFGFKPDDEAKRAAAEMIANETLVQQLTTTLRSPLKSRRHAELAMGEPTFDVWLTHAAEGPSAEGEGGFVVAVLRDATREKAASRVMSEFVSHVSHELRTPLSSLKAYVEMLMTGEAEDEQTRKEYFGIIDAETDRMARLIDEILNISRIESGVVKVSREPVSLSLVVREVVDVMKPHAEKKQIRLSDDISPIAHEVLADRDMMKQCVLNLVSNAVKYTPDGGKVRVRLAVDESNRRAVVEVTDSGLGIPESDLPKMFQKFFRVKANSKIAKGTGLGLNLVKNIVETVHGGQVGVRSKVNEGSTFSIALPLV